MTEARFNHKPRCVECLLAAKRPDLANEGARFRAAGLHFRNEIISGVCGSQILLDDPSGNPIELFQANVRWLLEARNGIGDEN